MPETRTITETIYTLPELKASHPKGYEAAMEKLSEWAGGDDWYAFTIDDAKQMGAFLGIEAEHIYFSGFWSQGDGACFVGTYSYARQSRHIIRKEAPKDEELHRIADKLYQIQRGYFYRLTASVRQTGRYSHEHSVSIEVDNEAKADDADALAETLRDFMRWTYKQLRADYEYQTSEEQLTEMDAANQYRWTENGAPA